MAVRARFGTKLADVQALLVSEEEGGFECRTSKFNVTTEINR